MTLLLIVKIAKESELKEKIFDNFILYIHIIYITLIQNFVINHAKKTYFLFVSLFVFERENIDQFFFVISCIALFCFILKKKKRA